MNGDEIDVSGLQIDHIIPVKAGGTSHIRNLATACKDCNAGKKAGLMSAELVEAVMNRYIPPLPPELTDEEMRGILVVKSDNAIRYAHYGWQRGAGNKLVPVIEEQEVIGLMQYLASMAENMQEVADALKRRNVRDRGGRLWHPGAIVAILRRVGHPAAMQPQQCVAGRHWRPSSPYAAVQSAPGRRERCINDTHALRVYHDLREFNESPAVVAREMNAEGFRQLNGDKWTAKALNRCLKEASDYFDAAM